MATTPTISQLQDLDDLADEAFNNIFTCNLTTIFQYARNDIISSVEQRDLATLAALRSSLCDLTQQNFDAYVDAVPVQRKVKHTTAHDIFVLGFCLVNKQRTKDNDKVFNIKHETSPGVDIDPEVIELGELVLVVIKLQQTVNILESQVAELQTAKLSCWSSLMNTSPQHRRQQVTPRASLQTKMLPVSRLRPRLMSLNPHRFPSSVMLTNSNIHHDGTGGSRSNLSHRRSRLTLIHQIRKALLWSDQEKEGSLKPERYERKDLLVNLHPPEHPISTSGALIIVIRAVTWGRISPSMVYQCRAGICMSSLSGEIGSPSVYRS